MKPQKVTIESEHIEQQKALCDQIITRAAQMMRDTVKAPLPMTLDRLLTYVAAAACAADGSAATAANFRLFADRIDDGLFHSLTGENLKPGDRH